jgi:DNA polymerase III epsilon subunit-like protein
MLFLDTETTDYHPGQIAQLSYILSDGDAITGAKNFYFAVDSMSPGAETVHGLSREKLWVLSGGRTFAHQVENFRGDFEGQSLVSHNVTFDLEFLAAEFSRCGIPYNPVTSYCTMRNSTSVCRIPHPRRGGYKWPSLEEAIRKLDISPEAVCELAGQLFEDTESGFHDARFDATAVYLIYRRLMG